jgi:glycosyltransferase involved in cell wall biosynthesis
MKVEKAMKILQVNNVYGEKSTGKITQVIHEALQKKGYESIVVYGRGQRTNAKGVLRLCPEWYGKWNGFIARLTGLPYGGCLLSTLRLQRIIQKGNFDVVHLQCINGSFVNIYRLIRWLKKKKIKTVVSLHAEFMYTANCGHAFECDQWRNGCKKCPNIKRANRSYLFDRAHASWQKMKKAFSGLEEHGIVCPVSPWTEERAKQSAMLEGFSFQTVYNGLDTEVFCWENTKKSSNMVLNVTAYFTLDQEHIKGGWYLAELAKRNPDVQFVVAGKTEEKRELPANLILLGKCEDQRKLAELYRRAKLTMIVSRRETYSMPCAESLCCGTPVVGFKAGAPEKISLPNYSAFTEFSNIDALEKMMRQWLDKQVLSPEQISLEAQKAYSAQTMVDAFENIYRRLLWN